MPARASAVVAGRMVTRDSVHIYRASASRDIAQITGELQLLLTGLRIMTMPVHKISGFMTGGLLKLCSVLSGTVVSIVLMLFNGKVI